MCKYPNMSPGFVSMHMHCTILQNPSVSESEHECEWSRSSWGGCMPRGFILSYPSQVRHGLSDRTSAVLPRTDVENTLRMAVLTSLPGIVKRCQCRNTVKHEPPSTAKEWVAGRVEKACVSFTFAYNTGMNMILLPDWFILAY